MDLWGDLSIAIVIKKYIILAKRLSQENGPCKLRDEQAGYTASVVSSEEDRNHTSHRCRYYGVGKQGCIGNSVTKQGGTMSHARRPCKEYL